MTVEAACFAQDLPPAMPNGKIIRPLTVLLAFLIADYYDHDAWEFFPFPPVADIAEQSHMTEQEVRSELAYMESIGLLSFLRRDVGGDEFEGHIFTFPPFEAYRRREFGRRFVAQEANS